MFLEDLRELFHAVIATQEDHAFLRKRFLNVVIRHLTVNLRAEAAEQFLLFLRDAEFVVGAPDVLRHVLPSTRGFFHGADVVGDLIEIDLVAQARQPRR